MHSIRDLSVIWPLLWAGCVCLYFPQATYRVHTQPWISDGSPLLKFYALRHSTDPREGHISYRVIRAVGHNTNTDYKSCFRITDSEWLSLKRSCSFLNQGVECSLRLTVLASLRHGLKNHKAHTTVTLIIDSNIETLSGEKNCQQKTNLSYEKYCFDEPDTMDYRVEACNHRLIFGRLVQTPSELNTQKRIDYNIISGKADQKTASEILTIDNTTSEMALNNIAALENAKKFNFTIRCTVSRQSVNGSYESLSYERSVFLTVFSPTIYPEKKMTRFPRHAHLPVEKAPTLNTPQPIAREVFRNASQYSTIYTMPYDLQMKFKHPVFKLRDTTIFNVTEKTGIVYVKNTTELRKSVDKKFIFVYVQIYEKGEESVKKIETIVIKLEEGASFPGKCDGMCSKYTNERDCHENCGVGSVLGRCLWNAGEITMSKNYSTCRPNTETCPDYKCDELEAKNPKICPQDCTGTTPVGGLSGETNLGIMRAKGVCSCDAKYVCHCVPQPVIELNETKVIEPVEKFNKSEKPKSTLRTVDAVSNAVVQKNESDICDRICESAMATVFGCLVVICFSSFAVWWLVKKRRLRSDTLKHVGSVVSVSAAPSDYVGDQERQMHLHHYNYSCHKGPSDGFSVTTDIDKKWGFPRKNLIIEEALGEGEFGMVMKAQAFNIDGKSGYTTVAVKMLKECASIAEFRDLWSEFNLLKEVNHPNVIRLLGVCAHRGPFYIIVEYCQHGSLKNFLRKHRQAACNRTARTPEEIKAELSVILTTRDLLSFAWQVCKGMRYLCQMKLVHRDLAARNVLMASGNLIKISDFGLTRDIYEADAYMKKSKGRIPVKWMAPESLYAQVYTSKSDVWSFGVLLWEIITMGANPYPGIPPERLFSLLKTGYRMDRPENCSDEIYAIMQKCWKTEPAQRPSFGDLADILDRLLQERTGYLQMDGFLKKNERGNGFSTPNNKRRGHHPHVKDIEDQDRSIHPTDINAYLMPVVHDYANRRDIAESLKSEPETYELKHTKNTAAK
ncbi:proto-oncogene tyrosine-protein kinase receptor Ret-like [Octopus vulgaris]|uniref:receptor protein-tyrosine kinase n=1 Tax=Octopus vulgaris TaxID=6645 RepID=A0AA36EXU4_OCTVU|nr:proto-oncogene tyrosine-protein kinase receptor Ret-like [Octopus vulgaris]